MLKSLQSLVKQLTKNKIVMLIAALALGYALYNYSKGKGLTLSGMANDVRVEQNASPQQGRNHSAVSVDGGADNYQPAHPGGENMDYGNADGMNTDTYGLPPSCAKQQVVDPKELLPKDNNSEFSKLNPSGAGDLMNVSLLKAGHHIGINTVGQSLRNANLQLRSEPPNPKMDVGPWNSSTITGDPFRRPLEIGETGQ
jgi:hypothetical protein